jgi:hypothetical protein
MVRRGLHIVIKISELPVIKIGKISICSLNNIHILIQDNFRN